MAAALWTRPLHTGVESHEADTESTGGASVTADAPAPTSSPAPPMAATAQMGRSEAVEAAAPTTPEVAKDGKVATEAGAQPVAPPRPATSSRERWRATVAPPAPSPAEPASAPECTPQVAALALCAPGAKVSGR
jgi:hypothetical protein